MYSQATTFISKWTGNPQQEPLWHGELSIRAGLGSHSKLLTDLVKEEAITEPGIYYVSTPLPTARHPRVITHIFALSENKLLRQLTPEAGVPSVVRWPPK